ncbi:hypothetical protein KUCAC02_020763, partial [Chaenocephalus aceratus]
VARVGGQEDGGHEGCVPGFQVKHYQVAYSGAFQKGQALIQDCSAEAQIHLGAHEEAARYIPSRLPHSENCNVQSQLRIAATTYPACSSGTFRQYPSARLYSVCTEIS